MNKTISIIGCGWLGVPLAKSFKAKGYEVKGSVTKAQKLGELQKSGIWPFLLDLKVDGYLLDDPDLFKTDVVIVLIPPGRNPQVEEEFPAKIRQLVVLLEKHKVEKVIFVSSTSVYADDAGLVSEKSPLKPQKPSGKALVKVERLLKQNVKFETTILRFGGLMGPGRNPARFIQRLSKPLNGDAPVNFIHLDDCLEIIKEIVRQNSWGEVYNVCCPIHPSKIEFYTRAAELSGITAPEFITGEPRFKIVDSSKLMFQISYEFKFPNPFFCM